MSMHSKQHNEKFTEANLDWHLEKLYADLLSAKEQCFPKSRRKILTPVEKCYVRGLLLRYSPQKIAIELNKKVGTLPDALSKGVYRYIEEMLRDKTGKIIKIRWDDVYFLLEKAGYKKELPEHLPTNKIDSYLSTFVIDGHTELRESEFPEVQVVLDSAFYVERPPIESNCYEALLQPGALIRLKAPQQMGKTCLITKVLAQLAMKDYRTVSLSFKLADRIHFTNLDKFLRWLCINVSRELKLPSQLDDYWDEEGMGSKVSCTTYFEEYLLAQAETTLALCLDDVDLVFPYPEIYEDFFGLLRSWYEKGRSRNIWKKLRLVIVHSTEVYIPLNINQSPFNVGVLIELSDFTSEQVQDFAKQHRLNWNTAQVELLMKMVGGHPYLLQQAFSYLKINQNITLEQLLETAPKEAGIYTHHLRKHLLNLEEHPDLASALKKVVSSTASVRLESIQAHKLQSMGLVKLEGNEVKPRCNLYSQYFCDRLGDT